jgi:hypothetical protein
VDQMHDHSGHSWDSVAVERVHSLRNTACQQA